MRKKTFADKNFVRKFFADKICGQNKSN